MKFRYIFLSIAILFLFSCQDENSRENDDFQRATMLRFWADSIIIPSITDYNDKVSNLEVRLNEFYADSDINSLNDLRDAWLEAYLQWQSVSMYDIGFSEKNTLRNYTNIFPTDVTGISENIESRTANLDLPSQFDKQGFPAIDYLIYGIGSSDIEIVNELKDDKEKRYFFALVDRLNIHSEQWLADWQQGFRNTFVENDGSSGTASVDKLMNDYLFYFEKFLRAGKVGIPAGVFSVDILPSKVEAPFARDFSKILLQKSFASFVDFYKGASTGGVNGTSIQDYVLYLENKTGAIGLDKTISDQMEMVNMSIGLLPDDFYGQIETNQTLFLNTYDEMQKLVVLLKVDLMQKLNIQVDYIDADGD